MQISGLHLLLTYQCTFECDHCFVWGSPFQQGTMTLSDVRRILHPAKDLKTVEWIYFEGGEPTLFYPILLRSARLAHDMGFQVGVVSNAYWAESLEDALEWLRPFAGLVDDFSVSSDLYHYSEQISKQARLAAAAAAQLGIPLGTLSIAQPEQSEASGAHGKLPPGESSIMYRGRAAAKLSDRIIHQPWTNFQECPHEDLIDPGRLHVDPLGYLHICQGIAIGNMFTDPLYKLLEIYDPAAHPIVGPLIAGGPVELANRYEVPHQESYADACHLCYETRRALRARFPGVLTPDQVYGVF